MDPVIAPTLVERAAEHLRKNVRRTTLGFANGGSPQQSVVSTARVHGSPFSPPTPKAMPGGMAPQRPTSRSIVLDYSRLQAAHVNDWSGPRTQVSEELRVIKRQLLRQAFPLPGVIRGDDANLIMTTSARPGEGKTFAALNLAFGIATEPNRHVLLVDADTSRQGVGDVIGLRDQCGLLDVLSGKEPDLSRVILRTDIPNFALLPAGMARDDAAELLASPRMTALLREMSLRYSDRIVLIDAPPCLVSSDPMALAGSVGQVVFIIEAARTQRDEIEFALEMVKDCPNISLILNKVQVTDNASLGAYGPYYGFLP